VNPLLLAVIVGISDNPAVLRSEDITYDGVAITLTLVPEGDAGSSRVNLYADGVRLIPPAGTGLNFESPESPKHLRIQEKK
jgi:hypothetical protein